MTEQTAVAPATGAWLDDAAQSDYLRLVQEFPLLSIRDDAHLEQAMVLIDRLVDQATRTPGEDAYLAALTDLVETYEDATVPTPPVSGRRILAHLMEAGDLTAEALAPQLGSAATCTAILAGERPVTPAQAAALGARFHLPADTFLTP